MRRRILYLSLLTACSLLPAVRADEVDDRVAHSLVQVARDPQATLAARISAVKTLGRMGPKAAAAVPDLTRLLTTSRYPHLLLLQEATIESLGHIGAKARPAVAVITREAGHNTDIDLAVTRSVNQIMMSADDADMLMLVKLLRHNDPAVRLRAVKALGMMGTAAKSVAPMITASLGDDDGDVRRAALSALRRITPDARASEVEAHAVAADLQDPDPANRLRAIKTLANMGPAAASVASALEALTNDRDPDVRKLAQDVLGKLGTPPPPPPAPATIPNPPPPPGQQQPVVMPIIAPMPRVG